MDPGPGPPALVPAIIGVQLALREGTGLAAAHERLLATMEEPHPDPLGRFLTEAVRTATLAARRLGRSQSERVSVHSGVSPAAEQDLGQLGP